MGAVPIRIHKNIIQWYRAAAFAVALFVEWHKYAINNQNLKKTKHDENAIQIIWIGDTTMIML